MTNEIREELEKIKQVADFGKVLSIDLIDMVIEMIEFKIKQIKTKVLSGRIG
jgi:hypothetical protein